MRDVMHDLRVVPALTPVVVADNSVQTGLTIDRQGAESLAYYIVTGNIVSGTATFAVSMQEGNQANMSDAATVADQDMLTSTAGTAPLTAAAFDFNADNTTRRVGYIGNKRYTRIIITPANNAANAPLAAVAVLSNLNQMPS
jgi:hypothetical protein